MVYTGDFLYLTNRAHPACFVPTSNDSLLQNANHWSLSTDLRENWQGQWQFIFSYFPFLAISSVLTRQWGLKSFLISFPAFAAHTHTVFFVKRLCNKNGNSMENVTENVVEVNTKLSNWRFNVVVQIFGKTTNVVFCRRRQENFPKCMPHVKNVCYRSIRFLISCIVSLKFSLRPGQTLETFQRNILQHCWAQPVA